MTKKLLVYRYFEEVIDDPLNGCGRIPPWVRKQFPITIEREEGYYLIARLKPSHKRILQTLIKRYKQLKLKEIVEKFPIKSMVLKEDFNRALFKKYSRKNATELSALTFESIIKTYGQLLKDHPLHFGGLFDNPEGEE